MAIGAFLGSVWGPWRSPRSAGPSCTSADDQWPIGTVRSVSVVAFDPRRCRDFRPGAGLAIFGFGMGIDLVPLFSIIIGEIDDHEVGSASRAARSCSAGSSLGIAGLTTLFFDKIRLEDGGRARGDCGRHLARPKTPCWPRWVLIGVAFAIGWLLPAEPARCTRSLVSLTSISDRSALYRGFRRESRGRAHFDRC